MVTEQIKSIVSELQQIKGDKDKDKGHKILAKTAPQKARVRDIAEFATTVRNSSLFDLNPKN